MNSIDIREVRLGKWYIPKMTSTTKIEGNNYPIIGYFDILEVVEAKDGDIHPWRAAYESSHRLEEKLQSDFFVQEIKAFTNITDEGGVGFSKAYIENFWEKESILLCMSMVHLQDGINIQDVLSKIGQIFKDSEYIYYFSFDYSGIILFAKDITIHDFLSKMFALNYNNAEDSKIVKDTFSFYGFQKSVLEKIKMRKMKKEIKEYDAYEYEVAVNINVRDYSKYIEFSNELNCLEEAYGYQSENKCVSGRHDISVINNKADLYWILMIHSLLEKYTLDNQSAFYAYETFVKTEGGNTLYIDNIIRDDTIYQCVREQIQNTYTEFRKAIDGEEYQGYRIAVREVCNSVLSILRNGFAEDFVICMYQPFMNFLVYLIQKVNEQEQLKDQKQYENYSDQFDKCFMNFFDALNSLVNCAMHTDRQFIQATSFSAILYDIPPKIMAYYMAVINRACTIMKKDDKYKYTFIMKPAFSNEINVNIISYETEKSDDRILQVTINERCLYRPEAVIRRMVHEIAHYAGDALRKRRLRRDKLIYTYLYMMVRDCVQIQLLEYDDYVELTEELYYFLMQILNDGLEVEAYSNQYVKIPWRILACMENNDYIFKILLRYFEDKISKALDNGDTEYICKILEVNDELRMETAGLNTDIVKNRNLSKIQTSYLIHSISEVALQRMLDIMKEDYRDESSILGSDQSLVIYFDSLISLYSEVYADMQMILVLKYEYTDYLNAFIDDEQINYRDIKKSNEDISRIAVITKFMQEKNYWTTTLSPSASEEVKIFHNIIQEFIEDMKLNESSFYLQNRLLEEYLLSCYDASVDYYANCENKLEKLRKEVRIVWEHKDICEVYNAICDAIHEYKEEIIKGI